MFCRNETLGLNSLKWQLLIKFMVQVLESFISIVCEVGVIDGLKKISPIHKTSGRVNSDTVSRNASIVQVSMF